MDTDAKDFARRLTWVFAALGFAAAALEWGWMSHGSDINWDEAKRFATGLALPTILTVPLLNRYLLPRLLHKPRARSAWLRGIVVALACVWGAAVFLAIYAAGVEAAKHPALSEGAESIASGVGSVAFCAVAASIFGSPAILILGALYGELIRRRVTGQLDCLNLA